jgi:uncharacterized protein YcfJ
MLKTRLLAATLATSASLLTGCTDNQGINAATGGLAGAAVGSQVGGGSGRVAATLGGAAIGSAIGGSQPTNRTCTYRNAQTGEYYTGPCSN